MTKKRYNRQEGVQQAKILPRNPLKNGAPGETRTPNLQIRSQCVEGFDFTLQSTAYGAVVVPLFRKYDTLYTAETLNLGIAKGTGL